MEAQYNLTIQHRTYESTSGFSLSWLLFTYGDTGKLGAIGFISCKSVLLTCLQQE